MLVVLFRTCDKSINLNSGKEMLFDKGNWSEIKTNGFYFKGVKDDVLSIYVENDMPFLKYNQKKFKLLDNRIDYSCIHLEDKKWSFICKRESDEFNFIYNSFALDPIDDIETDVNFGLWIMELIKNTATLSRFINSNQ